VPPVNVWDAEHALDADQARRLLSGQFPELALDSVEGQLGGRLVDRPRSTTCSPAASGVIDRGDACRADPSTDLSLAYAAFAGDARQALLDAYGGWVDEERELRTRVLAVWLCSALADCADLVGRPALLAESLAGLDRALG
jgi:hypothetical protein